MDKPVLLELARRATTLANDISTFAFINGCGGGDVSLPVEIPLTKIVRTILVLEVDTPEGPRYQALVMFSDGETHESHHTTSGEALHAVASAVFLAHLK